MTALRWESASPGIRKAYGRRSVEYYELRREHTNTGTWWTAWFYDGLNWRRLGFGNFVQARAAAIKHYNTPEDLMETPKSAKLPASMEYPETHQTGMLEVNGGVALSDLSNVDFGLQVAADGRVWVCIDGVAFIRFKPARRSRA